MIGAIMLFLLGAGSIGAAFYLKTLLAFGNAADTALFWGAIVLGVILVILGIDRLEREYGFLNALLEKRDAKAAKVAKAKKTAPAAAAPKKDEKSAKSPKRNPAWSFKKSGALGSIGRMIGFLIAHTVILSGGSYTLMMLNVIGELGSTLHWIPITVTVIFYLATFVIGYSLDEESPVFKDLSVLWHTKKEVSAQVGKILYQTGYAYYHLRVVRVFALIFIVEAAVTALITPFGLNFLLATPVILLISLIHYKPEGVGDILSDLIKKKAGDDWAKYLCPNKKCGVILGKYHTADRTALTSEKQSLGSDTYRVTDTYSNGYDTLKVHRTEKEYYVRTDTTYHHWYSCPRCGTRWEENASYSEKQYV